MRIEDYDFIGHCNRSVGGRDCSFPQASCHLTLIGTAAAIADAERATGRVAA